MKVVLLAGGKGTRLSEETAVVPKPMVNIGRYPMLLHVMLIYDGFGFRDFIIACGYKGDVIKGYFRNFVYFVNDFTVDLGARTVEFSDNDTGGPTRGLDWQIDLVDTGMETMTAGRIGRVRQHLGNQTFMATYGDGVGNVDIAALLQFHRSHGKLATLTAVRPPARFGSLSLENGHVAAFEEKHAARHGWINGGFFVFEPGVLDLIKGDEDVLERDVLPVLAERGELMAYRHDGFWQPMDTLREKRQLEEMWESGTAEWTDHWRRR